jgi:hypothetical protein
MVSSSFLFPEFYGNQEAAEILLPRLVKKVQIQGGVTHPYGWVPAGARGVLGAYVAAPRKRANAGDGPFSPA